MKDPVSTWVGKHMGFLLFCGFVFVQISGERERGTVWLWTAWANMDGLDGLQHDGETEPVFCRQAVTMYIWMDVSGRVVCGNLWKLGCLG